MLEWLLVKLILEKILAFIQSIRRIPTAAQTSVRMSEALDERWPVAGFVVLGSVRSLSARVSRRAGLPLGFVPGGCASLRLPSPDLPRTSPSMCVARPQRFDH